MGIETGNGTVYQWEGKPEREMGKRENTENQLLVS